jgi:protein FRA10AC1
VRKSALVKVRLCPDCSDKLNFHSRKRLVKKAKKEGVKVCFLIKEIKLI